MMIMKVMMMVMKMMMMMDTKMAVMIRVSLTPWPLHLSSSPLGSS